MTRTEFLARLEAHQWVHVGVCGGRDYRDRRRIYRILNWIQPARIFHGACGVDRSRGNWGDLRGADGIADAWALGNPPALLRRYPADWGRHGKAAGPIRNREMLAKELADSEITALLVFPGGRADCQKAAGKLGVPTYTF